MIRLAGEIMVNKHEAYEYCECCEWLSSNLRPEGKVEPSELVVVGRDCVDVLYQVAVGVSCPPKASNGRARLVHVLQWPVSSPQDWISGQHESKHGSWSGASLFATNYLLVYPTSLSSSDRNGECQLATLLFVFVLEAWGGLQEQHGKKREGGSTARLLSFQRPR